MRLKSRSKEKESEFLDKLSDIFEDPLKLVPQCIDSSMLCPFDSYVKKLSRMSGDAYGRLSGSADQFLSALGETYKVMKSESAPVLGVIQTPYGNLEYSKRGNTDPVVLGGVQNFDDPVWRMLGFASLVKTKKVFVFSSPNHYLGSCKGNFPGRDFLVDALGSEKAEDLTMDEGISFGKSGEHFDIGIPGGESIRVYKDSRSNVMRILLRHILVPDVSRFFHLSAPFLEEVTGEIPQDLAAGYLAGRLDARAFIKALQEFRKKIAISKGLYLVGDTVYRSADEFCSAVFDAETCSVITKYLQEDGPVSIDSLSQRKVMENLWPSHGKEILEEMFPEVPAASLKAESGDPLRQIENIRRMLNKEKATNHISAEPWSQESSMLISMIKDTFSMGAREMLRKWEKRVGYSSLFNSIYYAFLLAEGENENLKWRFSHDQMLLGEKILPAIREVLDSDPENANEKILNLKAFVR